MKCKAIAKTTNHPCLKNALKGGYCAHHSKDQKIIMYKKELAKLHNRVRFYTSKTKQFHDQIELIQRLDWIKYELVKLDPNRAFKYIVIDIRFKDKLEELFGVPFNEIEHVYQNMLETRNHICHKFTSELWVEKKHPNPSHSFHLTALVKT